ncbi:hypothetical protein HY375_00200 [Candidatus Berkelbacteria bacterium]|nr:hypothetical protein [Candidatus Berkelbacteria bacterium]
MDDELRRARSVTQVVRRLVGGRCCGLPFVIRMSTARFVTYDSSLSLASVSNGLTEADVPTSEEVVPT